MNAVDTILTAIARDPGDDTAWLALSDSLVEDGQDQRAELVRLQLNLRRHVDAADWPAWHARLLQLWEAEVPPCQPLLHGPCGIELVLLPPGTFHMGAQPQERWMDEDESPRHSVTLSRGFYLGTCQITRGQWRSLMERSGKHRQQRPMVGVSIDDCLAFCQRLTEQMQQPCRLPTEAEWEYACRACTRTMYCAGDGVEALRRVGWCSYFGDWDGSGGPRPVGQMRPNSWGLFDMHGNVWEWCSDWYNGEYYLHAADTDPTGPSAGTTHVVRGGSWRGGPWFCRSAERREVGTTTRDINLGFRVVAEIRQ